MLHADLSAVDMPEIAFSTRKFDADFSAPKIRLDVDHAAFPFFFSHGVHQQERLSAFYLHFQRQKPSVDADCICFRGCAERTVIFRASVNSNWYGKPKTFAAPISP